MITTHGYLSLTPPLALAVREGRKTQTMRPMRTQVPDVSRWEHWTERDWRAWSPLGVHVLRAPYAPGDVLWVREPAECFAVEMNERGEPEALIEYIADNVRRWVPHPPRLKGLIPGKGIPNGCHREAARTYVRVLSVEPRRAQSITEEEARAEGITRTRLPLAGAHGHDVYHVDPWPTGDCADSAIGMFRRLWDSLYRACGLGWDADPWCWCVRFERVEAPRG